MEQEISEIVAHQKVHRSLPCSSVHGSGHGSSVSAEMVGMVQGVEVEERRLCHSADGGLGNLGKHSVTKLIEQGRPQSRSTICIIYNNTFITYYAINSNTCLQYNLHYNYSIIPFFKNGS